MWTLFFSAREVTDWDVAAGATYYWVVVATDTAFNRSAYSAELQATAQARPVQVTFRAALPETTPDGDDIYMGGSFNGWNPAGTPLARDGLLATVTLTFDEGAHGRVRIGDDAEEQLIELRQSLCSAEVIRVLHQMQGIAAPFLHHVRAKPHGLARGKVGGL